MSNAKLLAGIHAKLDDVEADLIWRIPADSRFRPGQRVEFSRRAKRHHLMPKTREHLRGTVKKLDGHFSICVQLDGYKSPRTYHHAFFNPVRGDKLF